MMIIRINNQIIVEVSHKGINNKRTGSTRENTSKIGDHLSSGVRVVGWATILTGLVVVTGDPAAVILEKQREIIEAMHSTEEEGLTELEEVGTDLTTTSSIGTIKTQTREKPGPES